MAWFSFAQPSNHVFCLGLPAQHSRQPLLAGERGGCADVQSATHCAMCGTAAATVAASNMSFIHPCALGVPIDEPSRKWYSASTK